MRVNEGLKIHTGQFVQRRHDPVYDNYRISKEIGSGSFGKVFLAESIDSHQHRAIKEIMKPMIRGGESQTQFLTEVEILTQLDHPNIVKIYELYEDTDRFYIVTEVLSGGELFDYISTSRKLSEPVAAHIMYQILSAVTYCHSHHIVHRDLKPENLILQNPPKTTRDMVIKIIDFGTSCLMSPDTKMKQKIGTAYYIAPEVLEMEYTEKCDVWSCGVILYILLGGYPPFAGRDNVDILAKVKIGMFNFNHENWTAISKEAKELISQMLTKDYSARPTAAQCLSNPWIQRHHVSPSLDSSTVIKSLTNLQSFYVEERLRRTVIAFIAAQLLTSEHTTQLAAAFTALDTNGDGRLSREEMVAGYTVIMPGHEAEAVVDEVMAAADLDGNGFIDYSEFIAGSISPQTLLTKWNLELTFNKLDRDHSGKISTAELKTGLGLEDNQELWTELIGEADQNGDGEIDLKEFTSLMLRASRR